jgi:hypothetical protein
MPLALAVVTVFAFAIVPITVASVQGSASTGCPGNGTIYINEGSTAINFNLSVGWSTQEGGCPVTVSWKDASGHQRKIDLPNAYSVIVATSLPANGAISYSASTGSGTSDVVEWQIEPR